jgi:hypothetical protein
MSNTVYGLDVIRAYELSWLNSKGKPQLGILEIVQDLSKTSIYTWKLKKFLESINNNNYAELTIVEDVICTHLNHPIKIISQADFIAPDFFEHLDIPDRLMLSHEIRFICQDSNQPYIGTLNLILKDNLHLHREQINIIVGNILNNLRNLEFSPQSFVTELSLRLQQKISDIFVISVHLNRRGGISYQAIRSFEQIEYSNFIKRSILE